MDEYISKHKAYMLLKDLEAAYMQTAVKETYGTAARRIDQMMPEDVQPVRHGRWLGVGERFSEDWECSVCGKPKGKATSSKYCSSCGTKMDIIFQDDKVTAIKVVGWDESDV